MREIKFRAWDTHFNKMWGNVPVCDGVVPHIGHHCEIMQYTGLKDKNGVEIYEGDILASVGVDEYYILGVVTYDQTPDCIYAGCFYLADEGGYASDYDEITGENWHKIEVIGNIYENPELLKEIECPKR